MKGIKEPLVRKQPVIGNAAFERQVND